MYRKMIEAYQPKNEQEENDKTVMLDFIKRNPDCLHRDNHVAHITSSALVVNETMAKVLFAYHKIYDSWAWLGGHNDGDADLLKVAIKEAKEESGLKRIEPYQRDIFALDIIHVSNHIKHGAYVPDHLHLNLTFLLIARESDDIQVNPDEHLAVRWFDIDGVLHEVKEARMKPIYQKLFTAVKQLQKS